MGNLLPFVCLAKERDDIDRYPTDQEKPSKQDATYHFGRILFFQNKSGHSYQDGRQIGSIQRNKQFKGQIRLWEKIIVNMEGR